MNIKTYPKLIYKIAGIDLYLARLVIKDSTRNRLFSLSGGICAFPNCDQPLFNVRGFFIADVCHIEAAEEGGERYNPNQTDEERRNFENLILLCKNHHVETDDVDKYTVSVLKSMKEVHEKHIINFTLSEKQIRYFDLSEIVTQLNSQGSEISLISSTEDFPQGNKLSWKNCYFTDGDVKNGFDVRRSLTDEIVSSIHNNNGTIIFGPPHSGKTLILKRIMVEMLGEDYIMLLVHSVKSNFLSLKNLFNKIGSLDIKRFLVIIDDAHNNGIESLFKIFNYFQNDNTKFLFAGRQQEFENLHNSIKWEDSQEITIAINKMKVHHLLFTQTDARFFVEKVNELFTLEYSNQQITDISTKLYNFSKRDLYIFIYMLLNQLVTNKEVDSIESRKQFIHRDIREKIESLSDHEISKVIFCMFVGMFGIQLRKKILNSNDILTDDLISLKNKSILFKNGDYKIRHEIYATEFLGYYIKKYFSSILRIIHGFLDLLFHSANPSSFCY